MDLVGFLRRRVGGWPSAPGSRVPSEGRSTTSNGSSASTGRAPTALRASSRVTPPPRRTSRRKRFSQRSAISTASTAAAEAIAQEAFLAAIRNLDRFDRRRPFAPWLHRIVVNRAIDWTRARKLRGEVELGDYLPAPPAPERDGTALGRIADLPPEHRAVVVLRHLLEYTPGEIAKMLDLPRGTVNSRLRRALDAMKDDEE